MFTFEVILGNSNWNLLCKQNTLSLAFSRDVTPIFKLSEAEWCIYASVNYTIIGSDNGSSPGRRRAIIWTNDGLLLTGPLGANFSDSLIAIHTFSFRKMHLNVFAKWQPFCLGLNVLNILIITTHTYIQNQSTEILVAYLAQWPKIHAVLIFRYTFHEWASKKVEITF